MGDFQTAPRRDKRGCLYDWVVRAARESWSRALRICVSMPREKAHYSESRGGYQSDSADDWHKNSKRHDMLTGGHRVVMQVRELSDNIIGNTWILRCKLHVYGTRLSLVLVADIRPLVRNNFIRAWLVVYPHRYSASLTRLSVSSACRA